MKSPSRRVQATAAGVVGAAALWCALSGDPETSSTDPGQPDTPTQVDPESDHAPSGAPGTPDGAPTLSPPPEAIDTVERVQRLAARTIELAEKKSKDPTLDTEGLEFPFPEGDIRTWTTVQVNDPSLCLTPDIATGFTLVEHNPQKNAVAHQFLGNASQDPEGSTLTVVYIRDCDGEITQIGTKTISNATDSSLYVDLGQQKDKLLGNQVQRNHQKIDW
ncbi:MAG: hypothetical protein Q8P27_01800 [Candidatus Peregrinibacteria bacterium]|nr:hypothetical protein [Candidatus Peregrinibacteria bacterium]